MEKINQDRLIDEIAKDSWQSKAAVKRMLESFKQIVICHAKSGRAVSISKLGTFKPADRAARTCRSPYTGKDVEVPDKRVLTFEPAPNAKDL